MALQYLRRREQFGPYQNRSGDISSIYSSLYSSFTPQTNQTYDCGGIFNLEFSHDGSLLIAACEKKSIMIFDTANRERINVISDAHDDCVNCVKFLTDSLFATCSDDSTVALYDSRYLKSKIKSLHGHSNWVKNIEFCKKDRLLVTSGFDGSIFTWDINSSTESNMTYQKVFHTPGLMRCRLSPDSTKLVICTTGGYLILVHDLDLNTLSRDLAGFRPNLYRLMQVRKQFLPIASKYNHLFSKHQKTNRIELISDFPKANHAEVISSLQIHPHGWCALSRNNSYDEASEWSCVHDIQEMEKEDEDQMENSSTIANRTNNECELAIANEQSNESENGAENLPNIRVEPPSDNENNENDSGRENSVNNPPGWNDDEVQVIPLHTHSSALRPPGTYEILDLWTGNVSYNNRNRRQLLDRPSRVNSGILSMNPRNVRRPKIRQNHDRLLYFTEESNAGKGFIKELCFSSDGRMICSPYGNGIRLLSFSETCDEIPYSLPPDNKARPLYEMCKPIVKHPDLVVSTKFTPRGLSLVSGCMQGQLHWYTPI